MTGPLIPYRDLTYSRLRGGPLVSEHSCLSAAGLLPRGCLPDYVTVAGSRFSVVYARAQCRDVWDAGREDLVASVYVPVNPEQQGYYPELHVLND